MHVLYIGFVWPEPSSSAAGQNILSYMRSCQTMGWRVSFCCAAQKTEHSHNLQDMQINTFEIKLNSDCFNEQISEMTPDVVVFDRYLSFEQFAWRVKESCPNAMLVLDAEDIHGLREARHKLVTQQAKLSSSDLFMRSEDILEKNNLPLLYNDITRRELACIYQADLTLVLSSFEFDLLKNHFNVPTNQLCHIPFLLGQDNDEHVFHSLSFAEKQDFVFIGNFRHAPNYHALKILREQCWPHIYKRLKPLFPSIACHIYGAYLPPKAKQLENKNMNFFVHGRAKNQFHSIGMARVMLAPISFGAGVKGKLLDAMQCQTPSVTTAIGQEGISQLPWPGEVALSISDLIEKAVLLYSDQNKWHSANQQAKDILGADYQIERTHQELAKALSNKVASFVEDRTTNFLQQMLGHHQFQSSKYMSQWITAKNR